MSVRIDNTSTKASLFWSPADLKEAGQHDENRITEDGAEAVMLSLGHSQRAWRVVRRMQRSEYADWLLETTLRGKRKLVALEVSGVDRGSITSRLANKLDKGLPPLSIPAVMAAPALYENEFLVVAAITV